MRLLAFAGRFRRARRAADDGRSMRTGNWETRPTRAETWSEGQARYLGLLTLEMDDLSRRVEALEGGRR